jgi:hypothetical protein
LNYSANHPRPAKTTLITAINRLFNTCHKPLIAPFIQEMISIGYRWRYLGSRPILTDADTLAETERASNEALRQSSASDAITFISSITNFPQWERFIVVQQWCAEDSAGHFLRSVYAQLHNS